jgi:hypothetical protein
MRKEKSVKFTTCTGQESRIRASLCGLAVVHPLSGPFKDG